MRPEVRPVRDDELPAYLECVSTAFLDRLSVADVAAEVAPIWDLARTWAAFDGERVCGTFRTWGTQLTVPGGTQLPAAAVTGVTVRPTHRRQGILRTMVATGHAGIRGREEPVAILYASEYPIYGRFGYGPAVRLATWSLDAIGSAFRGGPAAGMDLVTPDDAARDAARAVFEAWRVRQVGEIWRRPVSWEYDLGLRDTAWGSRWKGFLGLHRDGSGAVDGYARYRAEEKWEHGQPRGVLTVDELHALDDDAYRALWRFLADVDLVATGKAPSGTLAERLPWLLTNGRAAVVTDVGDGLWVRLLDVPRALATRSYEREASLVLDVVDPEATGGRQRLRLDAGPDGATCLPTDRGADLTLDVAALGAAYLGGTRLRDAVVAKGVEEHRPGALDEADALLRAPDEPWCSSFF